MMKWIKNIRWLIIGATTSAVIGVLCFVFWSGLDFVTELRIAHPFWILVAPGAGWLTAWFYGRVSVESARVMDRLREALSRAHLATHFPLISIPLVVVSTWLAHLAGLSVGREGVAVQLGFAVAGLFAWWKIQPEPGYLQSAFSDPPFDHLLVMGLSAGFSAIFGVPLAGAVFSMELAQRVRRIERRREFGRAIEPLRFSHFSAALGGALIADRVADFFGVEHIQWPQLIVSSEVLLSIVVDGRKLMSAVATPLIFGSLAWGFLVFVAAFRRFWARLIPNEMHRPFIAGSAWAVVAFLPSIQRFAGLGESVMLDSFKISAPLFDSVGKLVMTGFAIGAGFRGGEVTPLFFIGASAGSAWAGFSGLPISIFAGLGLVAVFGAAAGLPLTCIVMAGEIFGSQILILAAPICFLSSLIVRQSRIFDPAP